MYVCGQCTCIIQSSNVSSEARLGKVFRWGHGIAQECGVTPARTLEGLGVESMVCASKSVTVLTQNGIVLSLDLGGDSDHTPFVSLECLCAGERLVDNRLKEDMKLSDFGKLNYLFFY